MKVFNFFAVGFCLLAPVATKVVQIDPSSQQYVDKEGRVKVFHGVNAVYKIPPYIPTTMTFDHTTSLCDKDFQNLVGWGFNVIRLGVMWEAVEPGPGEYNMTYLEEVKKLVALGAEYNVSFILDGHQDSMGRRFCGEGFPDWAINQANWTRSEDTKFPAPLPFTFDPDPEHPEFPNLKQCQQNPFVEYLFTFAEGSAWGNFYSNDTLQEHFAGYWKAVATVFVGNEAVLGYELLNEPWFGDVWSKPLEPLEPGAADRDYLAPLYSKVYAAIREVDEDHIVFYEPSVHETYLHQVAGFVNGPGGPADNTKQAFAYHIYCFNQNSTGDITNVTVCDEQLDAAWANSKESIAKVGGGSFLTEFGALGPHQSSAEAATYELSKADELLQSWAYWTFKSFEDITTQNSATESFYNDDGSLQTDKVSSLSRTYAPTIAAVPGTITMEYKVEGSEFRLNYTSNAALSASDAYTEVYFNEDMHYPNGYVLTAQPAPYVKASRVRKNTIRVYHVPGVASEVFVHLQAK